MTDTHSTDARSSDTTALALAAILGVAGAAHFAMPGPFDSIVPTALPGSPRTYTYASGVAELALAGGMLAPSTRRTAAGLSAALFVAVFPANLQMAYTWVRDPRKSAAMKAVALARLPLQIPLVTNALAVRRG